MEDQRLGSDFYCIFEPILEEICNRSLGRDCHRAETGIKRIIEARADTMIVKPSACIVGEQALLVTALRCRSRRWGQSNA